MPQAALPPATPADAPHDNGARGPVVQLKRFAVALLVAACLGGVFWGFSQTQDPVNAVPAVIESLNPPPGAVAVPNQSSIAADLQFGQTGVLIVKADEHDPVEIPDDQRKYVRATGTLTFTPGDGQDFARLPGGHVIVTLVYWPVQGSREADAREFSWSFTVL